MSHDVYRSWWNYPNYELLKTVRIFGDLLADWRARKYDYCLWSKNLGVSIKFVSGELSRLSTVKQCKRILLIIMIPGDEHNKNRRKLIATIHSTVAQTNASCLYLSLLLTCRGDPAPTSKDAWPVFLPEFPGKSWSLLWAKGSNLYPPYQYLIPSHNFQTV